MPPPGGTTWLPALAALVGTLSGVAVTFLIAKHRASGKIGTSEAGDLWKASESIRHDLTEDVKSLRVEVVALRAENVALRDELAEIRKRLGV